VADRSRHYKKGTGLQLLPREPSALARKGNALIGDLEDLVDAFRLVADTIYSGIIVCDEDSRILYINRFYADLLETDTDTVLGKHISEYFPNSKVPGVIEKGEPELQQKCSLRTNIDLLVNRIPVKRATKTIGVILQTTFKDYTEINELMGKLSSLKREVKRYKRSLDSMLSATFDFDCIIGHNTRFLETKDLAEKYANTEAPVLILGATGTGKELFAHAIHKASPRRKGPFVCVNCAPIPKELFESELFGYESGAFTGAQKTGKMGKIELANGGTLFLDEIGDIPFSAQSKLLRVLESKEVEKLGGLKTVRIDFRLLAATNKDLTAMIRRGEFREDLLYRLNAMTVRLPALAERADDIPVLVQHFLHAMGKSGKSAFHMTERAVSALTHYSWPGNIRELKNVIERALSLAETDIIDVEHLPEYITHREHHHDDITDPEPLSKAMALHEKEALARALKVTKGNMRRAAHLLGISRSTLYEKCKAYNLREASG